MTNGDKKQFLIALATLAELFQKTLSDAVQLAYWTALEDLTLEQYQTSVATAMKRCRWFPKPVELREFVETSVEVRALEAWKNVMAHANVKTLTRTQGLDLGDPAANAALRSVGGVQHLAQGTDSEHEKFTRPRFIQAFEAFAQADHIGQSGMMLKCGGQGSPVVLNGGVKSIGVDSDPLVSGLAEQLRIETNV